MNNLSRDHSSTDRDIFPPPGSTPTTPASKAVPKTRGKYQRIAMVAVLTSGLCLASTSRAEQAVKVVIDWSKVVAVSKTTPTITACPFRPLPGAVPSTASLQSAEFSVLRDLGGDYVRWHLINPARHIAEIYPPTQEKTSWDFSRLDADVIPFLEAMKGHKSILNLTGIPYWMFNTGRPIPHSDIPDDPQLRGKYWEGTRELVDPTGKALGDYYARIASWYTQGGFTDENGSYHPSGHHYELPWWGVLNEVDTEFGGMTPEQYTSRYDAIVSAVHAVSPKTRFVGLSLGLPSLKPEFFEYFLNPKNHRPGIPLDMVAYHFYSGAFALGGASEKETVAEWQYTFFDQAAAFLGTVRYIESIRKRLSPTTRVSAEELGALLATDVVAAEHPEKAQPIPALYWNLNGALFGYLYVELTRMGIDVATASGIYDRGNGPSISFVDPQTAAIHAPIRVLQLIKNNFQPGDRLVSTLNSNDELGNSFSELSSSDLMLQAFETTQGRKLLVINKRLHETDVDLTGTGEIKHIALVDDESKDGPARGAKPNGSTLRLGPFAVAVVDLK